MSGQTSDLAWAVRTAIYAGFAETGAAPSYPALAEAHGVGVDEIARCVDELFAAHQVAPLPDGSGVWMANPFSAVETAYAVETPTMTTYAPCAWDAFGVPAILGTDGWIRTRCAESGAPLEYGVRDGALAGDDGVIHMVVPIAQAWDDIGFT